MKRLMMILVAAVAMAAAAAAQPRAAGVRIGWGSELSYQHTLGGENFLEAGVGLGSFTNSFFSATALYNFMLVRPDFTPRGTWGVYAGPGAGVIFTREWAAGGIVGDLGIEYTFWFPLQLSLDVRPALMVGGEGIVTNSIFNFGLGIRYAF